MFYLTMHTNTFYLRLYGIGYMVKEHSDSKRGNLLPPHGLLFPISSRGSFYMHHPTDRIIHTMTFVTPVVEHWLEREIAQWEKKPQKKTTKKTTQLIIKCLPHALVFLNPGPRFLEHLCQFLRNLKALSKHGNGWLKQLLPRERTKFLVCGPVPFYLPWHSYG